MASKPKKLEALAHGPFSADIRLDIKLGEFSCAYGADVYRSGSLEAVRKWAREQLRSHAQLNWRPILEVNFSVEDDRVNNLQNCANLRCYMERYYVAWTGKKWVKAPWVVMPPNTWLCSGPPASEMEQEQHPMSETELMQQRIAHSHEWYLSRPWTECLLFPIVSAPSLGAQNYAVPYTEETWATMLGILDRIRELRERIQQLLGSAAGWNVLNTIARTKLLSPPEGSDKCLQTTPTPVCPK